MRGMILGFDLGLVSFFDGEAREVRLIVGAWMIVIREGKGGR